MKQTNNVSPLIGRKPPAVGALPHPVTHSSSVHPQNLWGQSQPPQVWPSQAQQQYAQNPPKFLNQMMSQTTRHAVRIWLPYDELELQRQVEAVCEKWNPQQKVWELPYREVLELGLTDYIME